MVIAAVVMLATIGPARPAAAETVIDVEVGFAGGHFVPGRPVPVRVTVSSDRLIRGDLRVQPDAFSEQPPVVVPLEVAGGTDKAVVVVIPTVAGVEPLRVSVSFGDASGTGEGRADETGELVGALPGAVADGADLPAQVPLPIDLGVARFAAVDEAVLRAPGALGPLGLLLAGPDGLAALDDTARAQVQQWIDGGGHLVVDGPGDAAVEGLPTEWQPAGAVRAPAGRGSVRAVDGAIGRGDWDAVVEATPTPRTTDGLMARSGFLPEEVASTMARDSGLQVPGMAWLGGFLGVYVVLVGPGAWLLVRRRRRPQVAWLAIGGVAAIFTSVAVVGGRDIRSGTQAVHASAVATGPAGAQAFSYLGLVSPSGTDPEVTLPADWSAGGYTGLFLDEMLPGGDGVGTPQTVERRGDRVRSEIGLEAGGYGVMTTWGPVDDTAGLEVTATADPAGDGGLAGTVRNTTDEQLEAVIVMVGNRTWDGGTLAPGEEAAWELAAGEGRPDDPWQPPETPWLPWTGWDDGMLHDGPVDYALWVQSRALDPDPFASGWVMAAGWASGWSPPVELGQALTGRTVFTTHAPVMADGPAFPADAVRREVLRTEPSGDDMDMGPTSRVVVRFDLPVGADPATPVEVVRAAMVVDLSVWDPARSRWAEIPGCDSGGDPVGDPFDDAEACRLPAGMVDRGAVVLRGTVPDDGSTTWPGLHVGAVA